MVALLVVLLLALPLVELVVIIKVGEAIGAVEAVALLVLVSLLGVWLVKRQGLAVLRRAQREVDALWRSPHNWWRASILNTARMSWFSSDRAVRDYAREIWHVPVG